MSLGPERLLATSDSTRPTRRSPCHLDELDACTLAGERGPELTLRLAPYLARGLHFAHALHASAPHAGAPHVHALVRRIGRVQARRPRSLSRNFRQPSREDDGAQGGGGDRAQRGEPELDGESRGLSATKQRKRGARKGKTAATPAVTLACSATS
jgi:hypothetical protein